MQSWHMHANKQITVQRRAVPVQRVKQVHVDLTGMQQLISAGSRLSNHT